MEKRIETSPELVQKVLAAKTLAQTNRHRRNLTLLTGLLAGLALAVIAVGLGVTTQVHLNTMVGVLSSLGLFLACLWIYRHSKHSTTAKASCPVCGCDWEIKEGRGVQTKNIMTNWKECPGCGTPMMISAKAEENTLDMTTRPRT